MARLSAVFGSAPRGDQWGLVRRAAAALGGLLLLGACGTTTVPDGRSAAQAPERPVVEPQQIDRFGRPVSGEKTKVAILLPLTGRGSEIGPGMLNAAEMALFDAGVADFELLPRDTQGTPEGAAAAARNALAEVRG